MYQKNKAFANTLFKRAPLLLKYHFLFFSPSKSSDFKWQGFFNYFAVKCGGDAWRLLAFRYYKRHHFRQSLCRIEVHTKRCEFSYKKQENVGISLSGNSVFPIRNPTQTENYFFKKQKLAKHSWPELTKNVAENMQCKKNLSHLKLRLGLRKWLLIQSDPKKFQQRNRTKRLVFRHVE